jgi:hypothetical protein
LCRRNAYSTTPQSREPTIETENGRGVFLYISFFTIVISFRTLSSGRHCSHLKPTTDLDTGRSAIDTPSRAFDRQRVDNESCIRRLFINLTAFLAAPSGTDLQLPHPLQQSRPEFDLVGGGRMRESALTFDDRSGHTRQNEVIDAKVLRGIHEAQSQHLIRKLRVASEPAGCSPPHFS